MSYPIVPKQVVPTSVNINTDVSGFNHILGINDDTVQKALDTIDDKFPLPQAYQILFANGAGTLFTSSSKFIFDGSDVTLDGNLYSDNVSGVNTGDQDLSPYQLISNIENSTINTSTTKYPTVNLLKTGLDLRVPYTGATGNVDIGTYSYIGDSLRLNTSPSVTPIVGEIYWDTTEGTPAVLLDATNNVILSIGTEGYVRGVNKTGVQINDGQVVYISGAQGNRPIISLAKADTVTTSSIIGIATQNIANNAEGFVTIYGDVHGYNTSGFTAGDRLYLSASTAGALTKTIPTSPNYVAIVATALNSTNNGTLTIHPHAPLASNTSLGTDTVAPTQGAVKSYVDTQVSGNTFWQRNSTTVSPKTSGDNVAVGTGFLVMDKSSGSGIKIDLTTPTFGWKDLLGSIHLRPAAGGGAQAVPDYVQYRGNIYAYRFGTTNPNNHLHECFIEYHIPHDYVPGTDIYIHTHWSQITVDTGGTAGVPGVAKWYFDITYADGYGTAGGSADPFVAAKTISVTQQGSTTQYGHMIAEVIISGATDTSTTFARSKFKVDGLILVRAYRDPTDVADTLDQDTFVHFVDMHYQTTGVMGTKDKNTPFYT